MKAPTPYATLAYQARGRARLRFKDARGNKDFFERLTPRLMALSDIWRVEARVLTGSLILYHQGAWSDVAERIADAGLFSVMGEEEPVNPLEALGLPSDLPPSLVIAGGLTALAGIQLLRGNALPPTITLLWYARGLASPFLSALSKE